MATNKKTSVTHIPMFPTRYYDNATKTLVDLPNVLSHAGYAGETRWSSERDENGRAKTIAPTMIENIPFEDELTYKTYYRGRSAAGAEFTNSLGQIFIVFMTDLDKWIPIMTEGKIKGKFIYCKRGMNYGIKLFDQP